MRIVDIEIGQQEALPAEYADRVLKAIGNGSGIQSPLVAMAVSPEHREKVERMLDDTAFQAVNNTDPATKERWYKAVTLIQMVLTASKGRYELNVRRDSK